MIKTRYRKKCNHALFESNLPSGLIHFRHRSCLFLNTKSRPFFSSSLHRTSTALMTFSLQLNFQPLSGKLTSGNSQKSHSLNLDYTEGGVQFWRHKRLKNPQLFGRHRTVYYHDAVKFNWCCYAAVFSWNDATSWSKLIYNNW